MKIVLIGTGNVATILGEKLMAAGHHIIQVFGRNTGNAAALSKKLGCSWTSDYKTISSGAGLYIVAVSDTALPELAQNLQLKDQLIVHTAGAVTREVFKKNSVRHGVLYPLQSLRNHFPATGKIPFLLDASSTDGLETLKNLVLSMGQEFQVCGDEQRLRMHLAAVWVNNFPNLLYSIAFRLCEEKKLNFNLLLPMIRETGQRIGDMDPWQWQTGPAIRKDLNTIEKHQQLLEQHPDWKELYTQLTLHIQQMQN